MNKPASSASIGIELFIYTKGPALPVLCRVVEAIFGGGGIWRGRAVGRKSEHRTDGRRGVKSAFEKLAAEFEGSLNAVHLQGKFTEHDLHPMIVAANVDAELSPLANDWAAIDPDDSGFWLLKRNLRRELLSLSTVQGYVTHRKIERDPSYLHVGIEPMADIETAEAYGDLQERTIAMKEPATNSTAAALRTLARQIAKQLSLEDTGGFIGYIDTGETSGDPQGRLRPQPDKSVRMDTFFDAAHRVTIGAALLMEQYFRDVAAAYPETPQCIEVVDGAAVHSFETWRAVWKIFLPAWHAGRVR